MRQMQVCANGHRWDPATDHRPNEHARWNVCPTCGGSVEMFSLRDTYDGSRGASLFVPTNTCPLPTVTLP